MNLALIHEHLAQNGGAEYVLKVMQQTYPEAPTYTILHDRKRSDPSFHSKDIRTSFIQRMPFGVSKYQWYFTLMPHAVEHFNLDAFDVVLSSCSAYAKGVITRPDAIHICYCHSPTRYLWSDTHRYVEELSVNRLVKRAIPHFLHRLRIWDQLAAQRVDRFLANSETVQQRIAKYYRRESTVVYPPVDISAFTPGDGGGGYYLIGGRLVSYKRYDVAVQAFNKLGIPLVIFGSGPEEKRLRAMAKPNISFTGRVSAERLAELYRNAIAFLHPQEEDFGIAAVESLASGRPVIAYNRGGATETITDGVTGAFIDEQSWEALADTVLRFNPSRFEPAVLRRHAEQYAPERFQERIRSIVNETLQHPSDFYPHTT